MTSEVVFKAIFKEDYSSQKDYLLRNEFRLLNQILEKFFAQKQLDDREERYLFIKAIQEKGLIELFEKEIKKEIKKAKSNDDYENLARLHLLLLQQTVKSQALTQDNLYRDIQLCDDIQFYQIKTNLYKIAELDVTKAFLVRNLRNTLVSFDFEISEDTPAKYKDSYLQYLKNKAKGYSSQGQERLDSLINSIKLLNDINYFKLDKNQAKISSLNNLALEYLLAYDYENAINAFEQLLEGKLLKPPLKYYVAFNCLSCLLKAGHYQKAITLLGDYFSESDVIPPMLSGKIYSIKAMAWIYVGKLKNAYDELPVNLKKGSRDDYFYSRLVLAIIYYLEKDIELALREVENILQINRETPQTSETVFCAKSLKNFFLSTYKPQKRIAILAAINTFIKEDNHGADVLPLLWLKEQLEIGN